MALVICGHDGSLFRVVDIALSGAKVSRTGATSGGLRDNDDGAVPSLAYRAAARPRRIRTRLITSGNGEGPAAAPVLRENRHDHHKGRAHVAIRRSSACRVVPVMTSNDLADPCSRGSRGGSADASGVSSAWNWRENADFDASVFPHDRAGLGKLDGAAEVGSTVMGWSGPGIFGSRVMQAQPAAAGENLPGRMRLFSSGSARPVVPGPRVSAEC